MPTTSESTKASFEDRTWKAERERGGIDSARGKVREEFRLDPDGNGFSAKITRTRGEYKSTDSTEVRFPYLSLVPQKTCHQPQTPDS